MNFARAAGMVIRIGLLLCATLTASPQLGVADEPTVLRVAGPPNEGYKDVYYGVASGLFKKYGLDVQPTIVAGGAAALAGLAGGSFEVAYSNLVPILQARQHGLSFEIIAPSTLFSKDRVQNAMLVAKDAPFRTARDLDGKTIGTQSLQDLNSVAMRMWIDKNGGNSSSVHFIEIFSSAAAVALAQHRVDAVALSEPLLGQALATGKVRIFSEPQGAIADQFQAQAFVVKADFAAQHADALTRFARAMHESAIYNNAHLSETVQLVSSFTAVSPEIIAHSVRAIDGEYVTPRAIQPLIDAAARYGMIAKSFSAQEMISPAALKPPR